VLAVPGVYFKEKKDMDSSNNARSEVPFCQFILNSNLFRGELAEDEQRRVVDSAAERFAAVFEEVAESFINRPGQGDDEFKVVYEVFRSRGVRGSDSEASLPSGDFWGLQLFIRPE